MKYLQKNIVLFLAFLSFTFLIGQTPQERTGATRTGDGAITPEQTAHIPPATITAVPAGAEEPVIVVDYNNPDSFFNNGAIGVLYSAALAILAYLGGFLPGLRNVKNSYIRSGAVIFAALAGIATFKYGAFTETFFTMIMTTFLPNIPFTNGIYTILKTVLGFFGVKLPQPVPNNG